MSLRIPLRMAILEKLSPSESSVAKLVDGALRIINCAGDVVVIAAAGGQLTDVAGEFWTGQAEELEDDNEEFANVAS